MLSIEDDGYLTVRIGEAEERLDAYDVNNRLMALTARVDDELPDAPPAARTNAYQAHVAALLAELGFPGLSHRAADRFAIAFLQAVEDLGKAQGSGPTPNSPSPTAPTS